MEHLKKVHSDVGFGLEYFMLFWLGWDSFILLNPQYWQVVNLDIVMHLICTELYLFTDLVRLIYPCYVPHDRVWVQRFYPMSRNRHFCHFSFARQLFRHVLSPMTHDCLHLFFDRGLSPVLNAKSFISC